MYAAKNILILLISFFICSNIGYCQQPAEIIHPTIEDLLISGNDSIDKKHNQAYLAGKEDAKEYFNSNRAFAISFVTSLLLPPVGLVTTVVISFQKPTVEILDLPNKQLLKNTNYTQGYIHKAKRMKAAKAWGGFSTGVAFFGIGYLMFYGLN
jgi:hypothetical protein